jgi:polyphosphate kinase
LIVRRDDDRIRRYVHLGTGNYNPTTSRLYTDVGLLSCRTTLGEDATNLFNLLTGISQFQGTYKFLVAPFELHDRMVTLVRREATNARAGLPARIIAKMNALVESGAIEALYRASRAGVKIDLIIRGVCALRPGVPGVSENITVRSIIGRFLEHSRVFYFANNGEPDFLCASADWMERNFFRRVEVAFPIRRPRHTERLLRDLNFCLSDNCQSWILKPDGRYQRSKPGNERACSAQLELLAVYAAGTPATV